MSRTLSGGVLSAIESSVVRPFFLYEGEFEGQTLRLTTAKYDLSWNSQTWSANNWISRIGVPSETSSGRVSGATVVLDSVPSLVVSLALSSTRRNKTGKIYLGFLENQDGRQNLILQSEAIDQSPWGQTRAVATADQAANPVNGATDAEELVENTSNNTHYCNQTISTFEDGKEYEVGIYAKRGSGTRNLRIRCDLDGSLNVYYDLSGGTILTTSGTPDSYGITDAGDGWFYCWLRHTSNAVTSTNATFYMLDGSTSSYLGDNTSSIYLYGAHIFDTSIANTNYIKTTDAAVTTIEASRLVGDPALVFSGRFDSSTITETPSNSQVTFSYESVANRIDIPRERRMSHENQKNFYEDDKGFEYVESLADWRGYWGRQQSS